MGWEGKKQLHTARDCSIFGVSHNGSPLESYFWRLLRMSIPHLRATLLLEVEDIPHLLTIYHLSNSHNTALAIEKINVLTYTRPFKVQLFENTLKGKWDHE